MKLTATETVAVFIYSRNGQALDTGMRCKGVPRGEAVAQRLKGICGQNGAVDRSGETLSNQSIRIPLQSLRASFPPGDAFAARIRFNEVLESIASYNILQKQPPRNHFGYLGGFF